MVALRPTYCKNNLPDFPPTTNPFRQGSHALQCFRHLRTKIALQKLTDPPEGGRAAEAFQSLFCHIDGKIRDWYGVDGCGRKVVGTAEVDTDPAIALSVI
jgi:hypothetical protein